MMVDGFSHPEVNALAEIGSGGKYKGNVRRDMLRPFSKYVGQPLPLAICAPVRDKDDIVCEGTVYILSPIHMADFMYNKKKAQFKDAWGTPSRCQVFRDKTRPDDPTFSV